MNKFGIAIFCFMLTPFAFAISPQNNAPALESFEYRQSSNYPEFSIIGSWTYKAPNATCEDTYIFQPDGAMRGKSGDQVVDSTYTISAKHTRYAFYELKHQVVTTNNQKDCEGEPAEVGYQRLHYIRYDLTGQHMIMCEDETALLYNCFGPLTRNQ